MNNTYTETSSLNHFYGKVYGFFAMALAISGVAAYLCMNIFTEQVSQFVRSFPLGLTGVWIVEIALVLLMSFKAQKNPSLTLAGLVVYSLINGLTLSITLSMFASADVTIAFVTATVTFAGMSFYGVMTKRDLSKIGSIAIGLLWGVIIATVINIFVGSSAINYFLSYVTVIIFIGLIAYDNQRIRQMYYATQGQDQLGLAAFMALQLYLDFINLFLSFLRIFSKD